MSIGKKLTIDFIRQEFKKERYILLSTHYKNNKQKLEYICPIGHKHYIRFSDWQQGNRCGMCSRTKKKDINFIRQEFEKEGYQLLTTKYKNHKQKLEYICSVGHHHSISFDAWTSEQRCAECAGVKKKDIEFIRKEFEKEGYKLLTKKYINNEQKLSYVCPKLHKGTIRYGNWVSGNRCAICGGKKKKEIEVIRKDFKKEGYTLLTTKYKDCTQKLEYICSVGHRGSICYTSWEHGARCAECYGNKKKDIEFIRQEFEKEGYQLLTTTYKNAKQKLEYICPKGHKDVTSWDKWKSTRRCPTCSKRKRKTIDFIRRAFEKEGYQLLTTEYKNAHQHLSYVCPRGHKNSTVWNHWQQGKRCIKCYHINNTGIGNSSWKNYTKEEIKQYKNYRANVTQTTNQNFNKHYYLINPLKLSREYNLHHLDHIFSVRMGFDNNIPPEIISSPINLQMLPAKENMQKHNRSDMSKETLYDLYHQFEKEIKN